MGKYFGRSWDEVQLSQHYVSVTSRIRGFLSSWLENILCSEYWALENRKDLSEGTIVHWNWIHDEIQKNSVKYNAEIRELQSARIYVNEVHEKIVWPIGQLYVQGKLGTVVGSRNPDVLYEVHGSKEMLIPFKMPEIWERALGNLLHWCRSRLQIDIEQIRNYYFEKLYEVPCPFLDDSDVSVPDPTTGHCHHVCVRFTGTATLSVVVSFICWTLLVTTTVHMFQTGLWVCLSNYVYLMCTNLVYYGMDLQQNCSTLF